MDVEAKTDGRQMSQEGIVRPVWANYAFRATKRAAIRTFSYLQVLANGVTYIEIQPCRTGPFRATVIADKDAFDSARLRAHTSVFHRYRTRKKVAHEEA